MITLKCKMCGGDLTIEENSTVCECEYCGSKQTVPKVDDEKIIKLYDRANRLRMANEFDKAAGVYESIIEESDTEAEAYWGIVLCKYGIEYVDDPISGKKIPTCHRLSFDSVMEDSDFEMVMENADTLSRSVYRDNAKEIEEIRHRIIEVSEKEEPYDIFICYKETDDNGDRTVDSVIAQEVYDELSTKGYRVFFSRITLEDKLGQEYEPYIFAALNSAKVMLVFGTSYDYYNAVWVKNEWSRYLKLMAKDKSKKLIPCFKDIDAYDIPKEFKHLQAQDMGKVGAIQDLVRGIDKLTGRSEAKEGNQSSQQVIQQVVQNVGGTNADALIQRGFMALEDKEWENAEDFFEDALNHDAQNVNAYLGKLMAECEVTRKENLDKLDDSFENSKNYEKVIRFADQVLKQELEQYIKNIKDRNELKEKNKREREVELSKQADTIAIVIQKKNKDRVVDNIKNQIRENEEIVTSLNLKLGELKTSAQLISDLEAEISVHQKEIDNLNTKITTLRNELDSLGIFASKRKKEIITELENLSLSKKRSEDEIFISTNKLQGYTSKSVREKIKNNKDEIEKKQEDIRDLNSKLSEIIVESNESNNDMEYDEAISLLKDASIKDVFKSKYKKLYLKIKGIELEDNKIIFGNYANERIQWRILEEKDDEILLISEKALDTIQYNEENMNITWENCTLRKWLNSEFINNSFSSEEQNLLMECDVNARKNPKLNSDSGNNTQDKVFLLSVDEVNNYFKDDKDRQCILAASASKVYKEDGVLNCWWWLRSPGSRKFGAEAVEKDGSFVFAGPVSSCNGAVRPALWINIEK